jgi:hypothetical protein
MTFGVVAVHDFNEYRHIGPFWGNMIYAMRLSLGNFNFDVFENGMIEMDQILFWFVWISMVLFSALIFLTFVIARVCDCYTDVKLTVNAQIYKERCGLIYEVEEIMSESERKHNKIKFPRYVITREGEH